MIPKSKWRQYGQPGSKVKGIIIHNTNSSKSAVQLEKWLSEENKGSNGCHFLVDSNEVRKVMPLNWSVYSVGNGASFGNLDCIAIEICSNLSEREYSKAEQKGIELIRELMSKYNLSKEQIYFHRDFQANVNCPAQIIKRYGTKARFLNEL